MSLSVFAFDKDISFEKEDSSQAIGAREQTNEKVPKKKIAINKKKRKKSQSGGSDSNQEEQEPPKKKKRTSKNKPSSPKAKSFECKINGCGKICARKENLLSHQKRHEGPTPYPCIFKTCRQSFATQEGLDAHQEIHKKWSVFVNRNKEEILGQVGSYDEQSNEKNREKKIANNRKKRKKNELSSDSNQEEELPKKKRDAGRNNQPSPEVKLFECPVEGCGKSFARWSNFLGHEKLHEMKGSYVCAFENCGKSFGTKAHLLKHAIVHTNEKPFVCDIGECNKSYKHQPNLRRHKINDHKIELALTTKKVSKKEEKLFVCTIADCNQTFKHQPNLCRHKRTVHKVKPELLATDIRTSLIKISDIAQQIAHINPEKCRLNCFACAISCYLWLNLQLKTANVASSALPTRENILIKKSDTGEERLTITDHVNARNMALLLPFDYFIDDELISYREAKPAFVAKKNIELESYLDSLPKKIFQGNSYSTGILYLEEIGGTWGHFLTFYIYQEDEKRNIYIIDAQNNFCQTVNDFISNQPSLYKEDIFVWHDLKDNVEVLDANWNDLIAEADEIQIKIEEGAQTTHSLVAVKQEPIDHQEVFNKNNKQKNTKAEKAPQRKRARSAVSKEDFVPSKKNTRAQSGS